MHLSIDDFGAVGRRGSRFSRHRAAGATAGACRAPPGSEFLSMDARWTNVVGMQPQEPTVGTPATPVVQGAGGAPPDLVTAPSKPKNRRLRLGLAIAAGVGTLLCFGGVGIAYLLYDGATKINRAAPDQVTSSFLRAYLIDRSDQEASLFTCKSGSDLAAIASLRSEMMDRERKFGTTVTASWESLRTAGPSQASQRVDVDLAIIGSAKGLQVSSHTESWAFGLVDADGWRVCSATKLP